MKIFICALLSLLPIGLYAQVVEVDCCLEVGSKASIIFNNNLTTLGSSPSSVPTSNTCNLKLNSSVNTSAGVYKVNSSDTILIRTLFSGVRFNAGCYTINWDGLLDDGSRAPNGNYLIKILSNNVAYTWGLIGNSSKSFTNNEQYNAYTDIYDIALDGNNIYYALGYAERDIKTRYAPLNDLGRCIKIDDNGNSLSADKVATNSNLILWSGYSDDGTKFIIGYNKTDKSQHFFSNGTTKQMDYSGDIYSSCILVDTTYISGLNVNSNYIFSSTYNISKVTAYNIGTGATTITSLSYPGNIAVTPDNAYVWVVSADTYPNFSAKKYSIGTGGALTATGLSVPCDQLSSVSISPTTGELAVTLYSTHQVKIYNSNTAALNTPLGLAGGYLANGPAVTNNKFDFNGGSAAKYGVDGSLWIYDSGNRRLLHLTASGSFIESISSLGINYNCSVNQADPTSVFQGTSSNLEFKVDYTKDQSIYNPANWYLANNWKYINAGNAEYQPFEQVTTFPNGKVYARTHTQLLELRPNIGAVYLLGSGIEGKEIEKDGSLWTRDTDPSHYRILKQAVTGYDSNNIPIWGTQQTVVNVSNVPFTYNNNTFGALSNPRRYFFYNPNYSGGDGIEYHLGSIKINGNVTDWNTSLRDPSRYTGPFPANGAYDQSGHSENCRANVVGSNVFWHQNAELGRFTQVCYTNHYNEDGLFIGQFGNDNVKAANTGDTRFQAGNSFVTHAFQIPNSNDIGYIHTDESKHAGNHFIRVSNLSSIHEDIIPVVLSGVITPLVPSSSNLMGNLPYASADATAIANNNTKWALTQSGQTVFQTSIGTFSKDSIDVYCKVYNGNQTVSRALGTTALNSWALTGKISIYGNDSNNFEILDINGKVIARINAHYSSLYLNENLVWINLLGIARLFNAITYSYTPAGLTINYLGANTTITSPYENGALLNSPGSIRIIQSSNGGDRIIDVYNLKFVTGTKI